MMVAVVVEFATILGIAATCAAIGLPRASFYRWFSPEFGPHKRPLSPRALTLKERDDVLRVLHEPRFVDLAPAEIYATLLDEHRYVCSVRTMYRVLAANGEVRERRNQLRHPAYAAPQLLATRSNELWSWDITKLLGPAKWTYYQLYVILDVFSRYVVGWMIADVESAKLAETLIHETCVRQKIERGQLTLHADRGSSMKSKPVALLLADLGVTKTHSRPHVSDDNPFSESQFKTLKYRPDFPARFGSLEDARAHCARFFGWYNDEHRHGGIGMLTPNDVHHGAAPARVDDRAATLSIAYAAHPERFVSGVPQPQQLPTHVWINAPKSNASRTQQSVADAPENREDAARAGDVAPPRSARAVSAIASEHAPAQTAHAVTRPAPDACVSRARPSLPHRTGERACAPEGRKNDSKRIVSDRQRAPTTARHERH